jgi:hypothetical protein
MSATWFSPRSFALRIAAAASLAGSLALAACGGTPTPVTQVGLSRETPEKTYEYFKTMVRNNQYAAEWSVFSPNAKRQANQLAGRNVDVGDYSTARQLIAHNGTGEMAALLNSNLVGPAVPTGPDRATVTLSDGRRQVAVPMARLTVWELKVAGEPDPYSDFVRSAADAVAVNTDGSITVRVQPPASTGSFLRTIPRERIEGFAVKSQWYVDDLRNIVNTMGTGAAPAPAPGAAPAPGTAPAAPSAPPPTATGSID